ncbi:hypothetical protein V6N13_096992 [Hibiscus sabdariffa]
MGDSSTIDWRKLFAAGSDQSLDFFSPELCEGVVTAKPPPEVFAEGLQTWSYAGDNLFLFCFVNASTRDWVLEGGPWHFQNKPLVLRKWKPNMTSMNFNLGRIPVWVHLNGIPLELFSKRGLSYIASAIGSPLYMDGVTASKQRLAYAKVCVEVSTASSIPSSVDVILQNGLSVSIGVDVPWLPPKCSKCSVFGHSDKACFVDSTGSGVAKDTGNDVIVGRNQKKSRVDPGPSKSSLEGLPAVAITPFPVKSGKGTVRGSNNQFAILSDKTNLCASIVDVNHVIGDCGDPPLDVSISVGDALGVSVDIDNVSVGLSVDVGVTTTVAQAVDHAGNVLGVFDDSSLDGVLIAGRVVGEGADGYGKDPVLSSRKTRNASLGVAQLIQGMKAKKKCHGEKGRKKAPPDSVVVSSQPPLI